MNIESENTTIKFKIHTLGCKVNLYESEAVSSQLGKPDGSGPIMTQKLMSKSSILVR